MKDDVTGTMKISEPAWSTPWHIGRVSYVELEAKLAKASAELADLHVDLARADANQKKPTDGT